MSPTEVRVPLNERPPLESPPPLGALDTRQIKLTTDRIGTVVLPWWPDEIAWSGMAATYAEQERPGRRPLLLRQGVGLEELRIGTVVRPADLVTSSKGEMGVAVSQVLDTLREMSRAVAPCTASIAGRSATYRITDLGITELEWDGGGQPIVAEVSLTLVQASDAAIPVGPIKRPRR
jgi:hypothetical protein